MEAHHCKYRLKFKKPSGTSRGVLTEKDSYFLVVKDGPRSGIGECGLLKGLSIDDLKTYESKLSEVCNQIDQGLHDLLEFTKDYPSIQFGLEQAFKSLSSRDPFKLFPSDFTEQKEPIAINGLIWMGDEEFMHQQMEERIAGGFRCLKMKVGALDFNTEWQFLKLLRKNYPASKVELRLDANGAFSPTEAIDRLAALAEFEVHSIEQPIAPGQWEQMAQLCRESPIPIALDEELIGLSDVTEKEKMLQMIRPDYIILKPSLLGGFAHSESWIRMADREDIGWWITSALESNIGLNAIAQWTFTLGSKMYQGLGTGTLYTNNFKSPLKIEKGKLYYNPAASWQEHLIENICL